MKHTLAWLLILGHTLLPLPGVLAAPGKQLARHDPDTALPPSKKSSPRLPAELLATVTQQVRASGGNCDRNTLVAALKTLDSLAAAHGSTEEFRSALLLKGEVLLELSRNEEAMDNLQRANEIRSDIDSLLRLGEAECELSLLYSLENTLATIAQRFDPLKFSPAERARWFVLRGRLALCNRFVKRGVFYLEQAYKCEPSDSTTFFLAYAYNLDENTRGALQFIAKETRLLNAKQCSPKYAWELYFLQGLIALKQKKEPLAKKLFQHCLLFRKDGYSLVDIAAAYLATQTHPGDETYSQTLMQLANSGTCSPHLKWCIYTTLGRSDLAKHRFARAADRFSKAHALSTSGATALLLANAHLHSNHPSLARNEIAQAFRLFENNRCSIPDLVSVLNLDSGVCNRSATPFKPSCYLRMAEAKCTDDDVLLMLAHTSNAYQLHEIALSCAKKGIRLIKANIGSIDNLAELYLLQAESAAALNRWSEVLPILAELHSTDCDTTHCAALTVSYLNLIQLAYFYKQEGAALTCCDELMRVLAQLLRSSPDQQTMAQVITADGLIARIYAYYGKLEKALQCIEEAITLLPRTSTISTTETVFETCLTLTSIELGRADCIAADRFIGLASNLLRTTQVHKSKRYAKNLAILFTLMAQLSCVQHSKKLYPEAERNAAAAALLLKGRTWLPPLCQPGLRSLHYIVASLGETAFIQKRYEEADRHMVKAIELYQLTDKPLKRHDEHLFLQARIAIIQHNLPRAINILQSLATSNQYDILISTAYELLELGRLMPALHTLDRALLLSKTAPCSRDALRQELIMEGHIRARLGQVETATNFYRQADKLRRDTDSLEALAHLTKLSQPNNSLSYIAEWEKLSRTEHIPVNRTRDMLILKAELLLDHIHSRNDQISAANCLDQALAIRSDPNLLLKAYRLHEQLGDCSDPMFTLEKAAEQNILNSPDRDVFVALTLKQAHRALEQKQPDKAERLARLVRAVRPFDADLVLFTVYSQKGNYQTAVQFGQEALRHGKDTWLALSQARLLAKLTRYKEAIETLDSVRSNPIDGEKALLETAAIHMQDNRMNSCADDLRLLQRLYPHKHYAMRDIQLASVKYCDRFEKLISLLRSQPLQQIDTEQLSSQIGTEQNKQRLSHLFEERASARMRNGQFEEALDDINRAIAMNNDNFGTHAIRAAAFLGLNRLNEAQAERELTVELFNSQSTRPKQCRN